MSPANTLMRFEELPVEAVARILSFLDWKDLLVVSSLSRFLREAYQSFPELQLSYALQTYAMIDTDPTLNMRRKLNELERRERAWRELDPLHKVTIKIPHRTSHIYDLSGGVYLLGDCKNSIVSRDTKTLRFFDLSTCTTGPAVREESWPEIRLETNIVDIGFGLDEFDLVAVVGINPARNGEQGSIVLSFRELSTGAPHPLAKHPDIFVDPVHGHEGKLSIMMEIVGPRLLLLLTWSRTVNRRFAQPQDKLLLFNWWEGRKVAAETAPPLTWNGFVFLSPELILLPNHNHTLEVARLPDVSQTYYSPIGLERLLILELPAMQPLVKLGAIQCRSEPNPKGATHPRAAEVRSANTEHTRRKRRSPVLPDPNQAIVLLQIYYREFNNEPHDVLMGQWGVLRHNVSLVLRRQFLLDIVKIFERSPNLADAMKKSDRGVKLCAPSIPWSLWSSNARWQADDTHVSNWITTSAGQKYVGIDDNGHLVVKDFNPYAIRHAYAAQRPGYYAAAEKLKAGTGDEAGIGGMLGYRMDDEVGLELRTNSFTQDGTYVPGPYQPLSEESGVSLVPESEPSTPPPLSDVNLGSPIGDDSLYYTPNSSFTSSSSPMPSASSDPSNPTPNSDSPPGSNSEEDTTWQRARIVTKYNETEETELRQLFNEECSSPLPCVEYVSKNTYDHHGLLMDEERIIGLRHDEQHGSVLELDVFTI
ncbi:uncharacterized protein FOMMEDRAFT_145732 [Fomitiporia mediterranea MF3/22]|uniref:uncharacterized protein n=1 Tax=Fomitiporia mediterranea (strain MF3/22) TaxID=694068 RepID=UPI00044090F7|nr:uncharacterized protein FOMMEDRAFT_145732 [Fomitiporia mediterranea MF3/22]EJD05129.1 hypothetical protein FOMMEDRAFT_145732 [Fomitiporia mediterranea MF3/22]